ncbi:MAG: hypothetical protein JNK16_12340 [Phycisphaerales bacterium]|nr:hypothetical protein [Phycisphaerales bacterium]
MAIINQALRIFKRLAKWLEPVKALASAAVAVVAGPGILGFLTTHATNSYALARGIRVPAEGVPYLGSTVSLLSFLVIAAMIVVAAIVYVTALGLRYSGERMIPEIVRTGRGRIMTLTIVSWLFFLVPIVVVLGVTIVSGALPQMPWWSWLVVALNEIGYLAVLYWRYKRGVWMTTVAASLLIFGAMLGALFIPSAYERFLYATGYGGGRIIIVESTDTPDTPKRYSLVLRTSSWLIVRDESTNLWSELPIERVRTLSYATSSR